MYHATKSWYVHVRREDRRDLSLDLLPGIVAQRRSALRKQDTYNGGLAFAARIFNASISELSVPTDSTRACHQLYIRTVTTPKQRAYLRGHDPHRARRKNEALTYELPFAQTREGTSGAVA